ncbi:hypothetical protein FNW02_13205 [Komarekiella sp. 'clone 1']|uniref:Uncharacterized protein n=1 Tax=Komarekiella delphini-convector SJRDD-AB1 TaxID=2593771 RepID=A0AA40SWW2_9NOST|nr:hypothetical protein [Komarekiella delphini-convector]MBD6616759.1 hypothetical protein [Komarekiella delphini-convector SJRDD-AB1]
MLSAVAGRLVCAELGDRRRETVFISPLSSPAPRQLLQRGGSRVGGFPDLSGLPWEPPQPTASLAPPAHLHRR